MKNGEEFYEIDGRKFKIVWRKYDSSTSVDILCEGSNGYSTAIAFDINNKTGLIKGKNRGNWKFTIDQMAFIYSKVNDVYKL